MLSSVGPLALDVDRGVVRANSYRLFVVRNPLAQRGDICYNTGDRSTGKGELA